MYEYAKKHGFITNEDGYLDAITERQDFCLNMTSMSDEEIMIKIKEKEALHNYFRKCDVSNNTLQLTANTSSK